MAAVPSVRAALLLAVPLAAAACVWAPASPPCDGDANCPDEMTCAGGACVAPAPANDDGDGEPADGDGDDGDPDGDGDGDGDGCTTVGPAVLVDDDAVEDYLDGIDGCVFVDGDLEITGSVASVLALAAIDEITGDLRVRESDLVALDGLDGLTTIGDSLVVRENSFLEDVDGLGALASVGGDVEIIGNPELSSCDVDDLVDAVDVEGEVETFDNDEEDCG